MSHCGLTLVRSVNQELVYFKYYKNSTVSYTIDSVEETLNLALDTTFSLNYLCLPLLKLKKHCTESILNFDGKISFKSDYK